MDGYNLKSIRAAARCIRYDGYPEPAACLDKLQRQPLVVHEAEPFGYLRRTGRLQLQSMLSTIRRGCSAIVCFSWFGADVERDDAEELRRAISRYVRASTRCSQRAVGRIPPGGILAMVLICTDEATDMTQSFLARDPRVTHDQAVGFLGYGLTCVEEPDVSRRELGLVILDGIREVKPLERPPRLNIVR